MKKKFLFIFITFNALLLLFTAFQYFSRNTKSNLLSIGEVSDFTLVDAQNKPFGLRDLKEKIWIANFFFTSCAGICPVLSSRMASLNRSFELEKDIHLVSFTVNPEQDSPEILLEYAKKINANTKKWHFLTGSRDALTQIAVQSFKLGDIKEPIFHSAYICLVDRDGYIRGYYDGMNKEEINRLFKETSILLKLIMTSINSFLFINIFIF